MNLFFKKTYNKVVPLFILLICSIDVFAWKPKHDLYENPVRDLMLFVVALVGGIILIYFIYFRYKKSIRKKDFFSLRSITPYLSVILLLSVSYFTVNFILPDQIFESDKEKVEYGRKHGYPQYEEEGFRSLTQIYNTSEFTRMFLQRKYSDLQNISTNTDYHKGYIHSFFKNHIYEVEVGQLLIDYAKVPNKEIRCFSQGVLYYELGRYDQAIDILDSVENKKLKNLNFYYGLIALKTGNHDGVLSYFNSEIENDGYVLGAYRELIKYYYRYGNWSKLKEYYSNEEVVRYIPYGIKTHILYEKGDFIELTKLFFNHYKSQFNILGSLAALLVTLVWVIYLIKLDFFKQSKYGVLILTFLISSCLPFSIWYITSFINYTLHFDLTGGVVNDLLYCVLSIGLVEEIIKVIPFLIALKISSSDKQPYDYILYACVSALGFAFTENTLYYTQNSLDIVHSRAVIAVFSHMFDATLIAYGIILAKFKWKKNAVPYFFIFLALAALTHGLYDFFLINKTAQNIYFLTYLIYLVSIHIWVDMRSNALNQSMYFDYSVIKKVKGLQFFLVFSLVGILMFEYAIMGIKFGGSAANDKLVASVISGSYFILYISLSLGGLDLIKSYWKPITLPLKLSHFFLPKISNPRNFIGVKVKISSNKYNPKLKQVLPKMGEIMDRKVLGSDEDWFEVLLTDPINVKNREVKSILVKFYNSDANPKDHKNLRILVKLSRKKDGYKGLVLKRKDFYSMGWAFLTQIMG